MSVVAAVRGGAKEGARRRRRRTSGRGGAVVERSVLLWLFLLVLLLGSAQPRPTVRMETLVGGPEGKRRSGYGVLACACRMEV